jgi:hypothetical protein
MAASKKPLSFSAVDDLAFAAAHGCLDRTQSPGVFVPTNLGALFEFLYLLEGDRLPTFAGAWLVPNGAGSLITAFREERECWLSPEAKRMGYIRAWRRGPDADHHLTGFLMAAKRAARNVARLPGDTPDLLEAAMAEMEGNIHDHAEAPETGVLAFRAQQSVFEFVVADRVIGVLASLRSCPEYDGLEDHGAALHATLTDGTSRHGSRSGHGHGFRDMFTGLMNLQAALRFRSGDHALLMDGTSPTLATAQLAQKPMMDGFFVSVRCQAEPFKS